ncbi:MAG: site-2 protease family protein [Bacteroidales bacterium]|nr:site-2 protease family protein [Bacteroidales bacterium]
MKASLYIGRPFGIRVTVHWTFFILIAYVVYINIRHGSPMVEVIESVIFIFAIFGCVILHELGHSLAARKFGIVTNGITLLPIGGVASLTRIPEEPQKELFVAIAGPLINLAIALILFFILLFTGFDFSSLFSLHYLNSIGFLPALMLVNVMLFLFNLVPAFPMDGGRLLRAGLGLRFNRLQATRMAARIGQLFAVFFAVWGLFHDPFLILIAVFVFIGAQAELQDVQSKSMLEGKKINDLLMRNFTLLNPQMPLKQAVDILLNGQEEEFVVHNGNKVVGILTKSLIIKGLSEYGQDVETEKIMETDFPVFTKDDAVKDVYERLQLSGTRIAPVLDNDILIGVIDIKNIHEYLLVFEATVKKKWF